MATPDAQLTSRPGIYAIGLRLENLLRLRAGRLEEADFAPGHYIYVGSAWGAGGLAARVGRHCHGGATLRWHIDYLRAVATPFAVWLAPDSTDECAWAKYLLALPEASTPAPRFGASDCHCPAHLIFLDPLPPAPTLLPQAEFISLRGC